MEADSNIALLMETCHCVGESIAEKNKSSSNNKIDKERMTRGSSVLNSMISDNRSKMTSGRKDSCGKNTEQKNKKVKQQTVRTPHSLY